MSPDVIECTTRPEWLQRRRDFLQSTDSAAILGVGYDGTSEHTVWYDKIHGGDDPEVAKRLQIGKLIEPSLREIFTLETELPCEPAGEFSIYRHPEISYIGATLDAWTEDPQFGRVPVELKNVDQFLAGDWGGNEPPLKFTVQVQHQMLATGTNCAYVFALIGGNSPVSIRVERHQDFINGLMMKLADFWGYVQRRECPPADETAAASRVLAKLYPHDSGETVDLPAELGETHFNLKRAKGTIADAERVKSYCENQIKEAIGGATWGRIPGVNGYYSWKRQSRVVRCPHCDEITSEAEFRVLRKCKRNR
jgi:predicted phage-related endonuclease